jgi:tRNA pseudouridine55 synthase
MNGVLVIDKPAGPTSHDVVAAVRRATGLRRVGHTGTLDPMATGVLPLVLGRATRLARFLTGEEKVYEAGIRFGRATDTYDATGTSVPAPPATAQGGAAAPLRGFSREEFEEALAPFVGTYGQQPPPFSAKKLHGVRAYELARRGLPTQPKAVTVTVTELAILAWAPDHLLIRIACSAGFYVRALAHALGARLGCGAHLETLRRTRSGGFDLDQAVPLEVVEREGRAAVARVVPIDGLLGALPAVTLSAAGTRRAVQGQEIGPADLAAPVAFPPQSRVRLLSPDGSLVGIAEAGRAPGLLHPALVLR